MTVTLDREAEVVEAAGRAVVYSLLATGLALPTSERLSLLAATLLPAARALELGDALDQAMQGAQSNLPTDSASARDHHLALFPPIASQDAPGYETAYRGDGIFQQAALLADIAGFYRAHGLRAGGSEKERLDHITVELEFMAVVARKEVLALQGERFDDAETCRDSAALFLREHLGCWGPAFARRCAAVSGSPWYRSVGALMALWIEEDMAASGVVPVEAVEEPRAPDPPDDGECGPCPVAPGGGR